MSLTYTPKAYIRWYKNYKRLSRRFERTKEEVEKIRSLLEEASSIAGIINRRLKQRQPGKDNL